MNREKYIKEIFQYLSRLTEEIKLKNSLNLTDISIMAESFCREFFYLLYGFVLDNINCVISNATAIDLVLVDANEQIVFQVASNPTKHKIKDTVEKFIKKELFTKFKRLVIVSFQKKPRFKNKKGSFIGESGVFTLNLDLDVWDIKKIENDILLCCDLDKIIQIHDFLNKEFGHQESDDIKPNHKSKKELLIFFDSYLKVFNNLYNKEVNSFIDFSIKLDGKTTEIHELFNNINNKESILIYGPSGCGKSLLLKKISLEIIKQNKTLIPIIMEAKYFNGSYEDLLNEAVYPFKVKEIFDASKKMDYLLLVILDGLNELAEEHQNTLLSRYLAQFSYKGSRQIGS